MSGLKEIRIEIPNNQYDVITDFLGSSNLKYAEVKLASNDTLFILKVEDNVSNELLHELKARGVGEVFGNISLIHLGLYIDSGSDNVTLKKSEAANIEEILANIEDSAVVSFTYVTLVLLSGALAAFGLLSESIVIIIGSMIVAPLMGPIALTSIGVLLPGRRLLQKGLAAEGIGILFTIGMGFLIGLSAKFLPNVDAKESDQMMIRSVPNETDVIFAIVSAIAAGVIISKGQSLSIVGVAIAASLAPPAATIGLYLAFNDLAAAQGAGLLLLINILAINASCSIMFTIFRLQSKAGISMRMSLRAQRINRLMIGSVLLLFFILSGFLVYRAISGDG